MKPYRVAIDWDALEALRSRSKAEQREVAGLVARLREHPFQTESFAETDEAGRINQVAVLGDLLVHYWADHAERVVRITRIEAVD